MKQNGTSLLYYFRHLNIVRFCNVFLGWCRNRTSEKCEKPSGRLQHLLQKKKKTQHHLVVVLFLSSLFPCTSTTLHMMICHAQ